MAEDRAKAGPSWPLFLLLVLMAFGVSVGGLMTWHHETQLYSEDAQQGELVGCEASEQVNCDIVNTSDYSEIAGVPIATMAIPTYLTFALLALLALRGRRETLPLILVGGLGAVAYSGFLAWVSVTQLDYVCSWCMRLYAVNAATPVLALLAGAHRAPRSPSALGPAIGAFLGLTVVAVGGQKAFRASLLGGTPEVAALDASEPAEAAGAGERSDPQGPAPVLSFEVTTEDKNKATLTTSPGDAWKGNPEATVAVVEFADLECGYCKRASSQLERLYNAYQDRVVFVFKHFPMDPACNPGVNNRKHRDACQAAKGAVCAQEQGRFWAYHDLAFKNQHALESENLQAYAEKAGVDLAQWEACMKDGASGARVVADGEAGKALDIHGTPRIFINGKLYRSGTSAEQMARAIELALGTAAKDASEAARAMAEDRETIHPIPADVPEMQEIHYGGLSFSIDTFEASLEGGAAAVGKHQIPATRMSWYAARDACEAAGKRLCTEAEWTAACQGAAPVDDDGDGEYADDLVEGTSYPYGDFHDPRRCWAARDRTRERPVYTGEMPGCVSADGVYDLTGNVEEWVGDSPETAVLLGGGYDTSDDHARCYRRNNTFGPGFANIRTGFRCCK
jgi:protein-disulfide isomerase/uncharacterized membrane protein